MDAPSGTERFAARGHFHYKHCACGECVPADEQPAAKPPLGQCPLTASHARRACDNGGSCWCIEHPDEVAAINAHPEVIEARSAAMTWDEPRPYDRHRVGLAAAHGGIDDVRERLSTVMSRVGSREAYLRLLAARNSLLEAQDLIRLELERGR